MNNTASGTGAQKRQRHSLDSRLFPFVFRYLTTARKNPDVPFLSNVHTPSAAALPQGKPTRGAMGAVRHGNWRMDWGDAALADHAIDPDVDKIHCFLRGEISQWAQAHNRAPQARQQQQAQPAHPAALA
ncbi:hypothetical protein CSIM01_10702 [Colletotrichum simmondsii]|uniref:Uncharacterized protein n=1 Tax=Colletotrichum simmondsii TaxID=703756 RepID=A0A135SLR5_9PEZI|nr:hypothetical protein CSIM01_10702 [Colletotrichum simmondsii]